MKKAGAIIFLVFVLAVAGYLHFDYEQPGSTGSLRGPSSVDSLPNDILTTVDLDPRFGDGATDHPASSSLLVTTNNAQHIELRSLGTVAELQARALAGDLEAAYDLYRIFASCYRNSTPEGCRRDEVDANEAIAWLTMAADAEYLPAQTEYFTALYITVGEPTKNQEEKSILHLKSAADKGAADAMYWLVTLSTNSLDFTKTYDSDDANYVLNRTDAYAYLLVAAAIYEKLGIRSNVSSYAENASTQFSPSQAKEARRRAQALLDKDECCKVWKY